MIVLTAWASACAPAPVRMAATDASEMLELFAAGAAPTDVCTPDGRAALRGAVRAYGAAMAEAGQTWPAMPAPDEEVQHSRVEAAVMVSLAAGFIEVSDLRAPARARAREVAASYWPQVRGVHRAASLACPEVVELQVAASRFVTEMNRYQRLHARAARERNAVAQQRAQRQADRVDTIRREMDALAERIAAQLSEAG